MTSAQTPKLLSQGKAASCLALMRRFSSGSAWDAKNPPAGTRQADFLRSL